MKKTFEPNCTKYNPKYDIILKRTPSCPSWSTLTSRKNYIKEDNFPFYINPQNILDKTTGKTFIDMSKQTKRNLLNDNENNINNKKYKSRVKSSINLSKSFSNTTILLNKPRPQTGIIRRKSSLKCNLSTKSKIIENEKNITTTSLEDSYEDYKNLYNKQLKKSKTNENIEEKNIKRKIKAPNFDQFISREDYYKLKDKN